MSKSEHKYKQRLCRSVEDRFWEKVDKSAGSDGCWIWTAGISSNGYGGFWLGDGKCIQSHIFSYTSSVGPIPDGLELDHLCRNRSCVNPKHLEPVTRKINLLRSPITGPALNLKKTICKNGHPLFGENLYVNPKTGGRYCRECMKIRNNERYHRHHPSASYYRSVLQ